MRPVPAGPRLLLATLSVLLFPAPFGMLFGRDYEASESTPPKHTNRLAKETSPYLLLHAHNPVDWYPWGDEAFKKAKAEGKPIFLSVGYSACYWCHVMERECFENEAIAKILNEHFICVKVDREERPDVDQVYMAALQAFGNGGGWPMSMFLTPDGRPFFGGTYFPPTNREGREGFPSLLGRVAEAWRDHRAEIEQDADRLTEHMRKALANPGSKRAVRQLSRAIAEQGVHQLAAQYDPEFGGFGFDPAQTRKPKFPEPTNLLFLLEQHRRSTAAAEGQKEQPRQAKELVEGPTPLAMVTNTLDHLARGGIRDQLAGGYHRYSTERTWTVPHFEKMLYDNAQLVSGYVLAYELTGDPRWRQEAEATLAFVAQSFTSPEGGFYSSLDAESGGVEGQYYVWTREEVKHALGNEADLALFSKIYGLDREPNFEANHYVLFQPRPLADQAKAVGMKPEALEARLAPLRQKLLDARGKRPAPPLDDKIITAWNGLMIAAYADAYRVLKNEPYRRAAEKCADLVLSKLRTPEGRLLRTYRQGHAKLPGYLEDYAYLVHGLLRLHAATADPERLVQAKQLADRMIADFQDEQSGGFFTISKDSERLLARPKDHYDGALPSGNALAARDLVALFRATCDPSYSMLAERTLSAFASPLSEVPASAPTMLIALQEYLDANPEKARRKLVGDPPVRATSDDVVTAQASLATEEAARGRELEIRLNLEIKDGWHIYANDANSELAIPTSVLAERAAPFSLASVTYPKSRTKLRLVGGTEELPTYESKAIFLIRARLRDDVANWPEAIEFKVRYQACNDNACLAPATSIVKLPLPPASAQ